MLLTVYPNNEIRARIPVPPLTKRREGGARRWRRPETLNLSIVEKLRSENESPFAPPPTPRDRVGYGGLPSPRQFTLRARRLIARCGGALGSLGGRESTLFLTGTLPGSLEGAFRAMAAHSAWIVHELLTHLPRLGGVKSADLNTIWVWEWQKRGALHWHCVLEAPSSEAARKIHEGFKALWIRVIESVGKKASVDMAAKNSEYTHAGDYGVWRTRSEYARKNPARYLSKYVGKIKSLPGSDGEYFPSRWYGISRRLHSLCRDMTLSVSTHSASKIPDSEFVEELDASVLERLFGLCNRVVHFPDKVRDGYTFVFYVPEEKREEIMEVARGFCRGELKRVVISNSGRPKNYQALEAIAKRRCLLERFMGDLGQYYLALYSDWRGGLHVPEEELFWLEHYASELLFRAGYGYQVKCPKEAERHLTGQSGTIMEPPSGADRDWTQFSLLP